MSPLYRADEDSTGPRDDLRQAVRRVEKERTAGIIFSVGLAMAGAVGEGLAFSSGVEVLLVGILAALCCVHAGICGLRIEGIKREMRALR